MDGLDCLIIATNWFESLQGMATVWLKELTGQHNISSHFLPQLNERSASEILDNEIIGTLTFND